MEVHFGVGRIPIGHLPLLIKVNFLILKNVAFREEIYNLTASLLLKEDFKINAYIFWK